MFGPLRPRLDAVDDTTRHDLLPDEEAGERPGSRGCRERRGERGLRLGPVRGSPFGAVSESKPSVSALSTPSRASTPRTALFRVAALRPSLGLVRRFPSVLRWPPQGLLLSRRARWSWGPRRPPFRSRGGGLGSCVSPNRQGLSLLLEQCAGLEPAIYRGRVCRLYQLGQRCVHGARALPVVPPAFDRPNATRALAFALAGFTVSSGFRELPPSTVAMPGALGFQTSGSTSRRKPPTTACPCLLAGWMGRPMLSPAPILRPSLCGPKTTGLVTRHTRPPLRSDDRRWTIDPRGVGCGLHGWALPEGEGAEVVSLHFRRVTPTSPDDSMQPRTPRRVHADKPREPPAGVPVRDSICVSERAVPTGQHSKMAPKYERPVDASILFRKKTLRGR